MVATDKTTDAIFQAAVLALLQRNGPATSQEIKTGIHSAIPHKNRHISRAISLLFLARRVEAFRVPGAVLWEVTR